MARVAVGAALGCLVLGGCTEQTDPAAGPAAQRSHSNPPESPGPTASVRSSEEATSEACARAQRRAVTNSGLWRAVDAVTSSPTGYSAEAARLVRADLARIEDSLAGRCAGDVPDEAARFVRRARRPAAAAQFGDAQLDEVLKAWLDWSRTAGGERDALGVLRELKACRELLRDLDASYRVWWAWTETGKVWWIELSWDNRTDATLAGSTMGVVAVTRMLQDPFDWAGHPRPSPGRNATLRWGASSADDLAVPPGASKQLVAPDIDQDVHTTATGTLDVRDVSVNLSPPRTDTGCAVPVPERS